MLLAILVATYYVAINIYGVIIIRLQKKESARVNECKEEKADEKAISTEDNISEGDAESQEEISVREDDKEQKKKKKKNDIEDKPCSEVNKNRIRDSKIIVTAVLGGALGIYVCMLGSKYRIKNLIFMVAMPVLIALNVYFLVMAFNSWIVY